MRVLPNNAVLQHGIIVANDQLDVAAKASGLFEISDDAAFFAVLKTTLEEFRATRAKKPAQLLLLVLGLSHLREWIAPGYKLKVEPRTPAERFVFQLWKNPDYQTIALLANHAKHQRRSSLPKTQTTNYVEMFDNRDTPIDTWADFDDGPASSYQYGERDLEALFVDLIDFYEKEWFSRPLEERLE